jgi:hypothetical protein
MTIYLYVKTHNITGLKYLGKTNRCDPHNYLGSGIYWRAHLKSHGNNYSTEILKECQTQEEVKYWGTYYSNLWDIVNSKGPDGRKLWANLRPEHGAGGSLPGKDSYRFGKKHSPESRKKISKATKGKQKPDGFGKKISLAQKGRPGRPMTEIEKQRLSELHTGKIVSTETRQKISKALTGKSKSLAHRIKIQEIAKKRCKPLITPAGIFNSRDEAAKHYNIKPESMGSRIKRSPDKYYYQNQDL